MKYQWLHLSRNNNIELNRHRKSNKQQTGRNNQTSLIHRYIIVLFIKLYKYDYINQIKHPNFFSLFETDMTLESDGNDDLLSVTVEKGKDTQASTTSEANADKSSNFYLSVSEPQLTANYPGSSSPKRQFAELGSDYASESYSNERQHKQGKFFSDEKSPSTATPSFPTSKDRTHSSSCSSDSESLPDCSDLSDFCETVHTNTAEQNLSCIKEDYELVGMLGEIIGLPLTKMANFGQNGHTLKIFFEKKMSSDALKSKQIAKM